jgi:tRNA threonylcarbamoyladenosine biosynthesis protein TsaB
MIAPAMIILAVDTSGRQGSVALGRQNAGAFEVLGLAFLEGRTYSARLVPAIAGLLASAGLSKSDLDGFVVVDGPGSFTGLRVGLSTVKALCEVMRRPLTVVSMLEALAIIYGTDHSTVTAVLDAGRGEVYAADYEISAPGPRLKRQFMVKLADIGSQFSADRNVITTFREAAGTLAGLGKVEVVQPLHADTIARIGMRKLLAGDTVDPTALDANYIRRSDAELFSRPSR